MGNHGALESGRVTKLRRPGGNRSGTESLTPTIGVKRVKLRKEIAPDAGLLTFTHPLTYLKGRRIADFASANRLPTVCEWRELAEPDACFPMDRIPSNTHNAARLDKIFENAGG